MKDELARVSEVFPSLSSLYSRTQAGISTICQSLQVLISMNLYSILSSSFIFVLPISYSSFLFNHDFLKLVCVLLQFWFYIHILVTNFLNNRSFRWLQAAKTKTQRGKKHFKFSLIAAALTSCRCEYFQVRLQNARVVIITVSNLKLVKLGLVS